eukprot:CAMPEP_0201552554 /NCGR_PEP_ID=MMETSP0173_2-20130828/16782_1 /ASSEMBLY_ACC=CAM_ASM_000268 /TAXON_ID=218659 /ORGANISM="Vexillifera sp., Strain DIVA3 564/2" /LENGTH=392 /DNA_ID=CAMNT_0047963055 /DNA_START=118 /DNA_END=1295 /DNA_ORIENTATION=-
MYLLTTNQTSFLSSNSSQNITNSYPAFGNILPLGIYYTKVGIGSPVQDFLLAIDTGSTDLLLPAQGCDGCHPNVTGEFDVSASSTYRSLACQNNKVRCNRCFSSECGFINTYETCDLSNPQAPCSVEGNLATDTVTFPPQLIAPEMVFGLIRNQTKNFQQFYYIDGVMGLSYPGSSSFGYHSVFQALVDAGLVENVFSMCFNEKNGGVLTFGGYDKSLMDGDIMWSPQTSNRAYEQHLVDVSVNGKRLHVPSGNIIIDSGTNVLLQPHDAFNAITKAISEPCRAENVDLASIPQGVCSGELFEGTQCYQYTQSDLDWFPELSLDLTGAELKMNGTTYLVQPADASHYCFGIKNTGFFGLNIIGDTTMQSYLSIFDNVNHRIGWAPINRANCR